MNQPSTERYCQGLRSQDRSVIEAIYATFADPIARFVQQNSGSRSDARDVFQEGVTILYEQVVQGLEIADGKFGGYLYAVCRNHWLNELKKRKRQREVTIRDLDVYEEEVTDVLVLAEQIQNRRSMRALFLEKFQDLGPRCRELLELNWSGKSLKEVAAIMEIAYGFVRKRKTECTKRLFQLIQTDPRYNQLKSEADE